MFFGAGGKAFIPIQVILTALCICVVVFFWFMHSMVKKAKHSDHINGFALNRWRCFIWLSSYDHVFWMEQPAMLIAEIK